ncbi:hypothetical protein AB7714_28225 [Tardiphaga sp. 1201_B9_N1_1]|uniref:hypothetical protein n=1 Tax=unclassified Tardiphaga TaxID=2631404 RepID=UPI003F24FFE0
MSVTSGIFPGGSKPLAMVDDVAIASAPQRFSKRISLAKNEGLHVPRARPPHCVASGESIDRGLVIGVASRNLNFNEHIGFRLSVNELPDVVLPTCSGKDLTPRRLPFPRMTRASGSVLQAVTFGEKDARRDHVVPEVGMVVVTSRHGSPSILQGEYLDLLGPMVFGRDTKPFRYKELKLARGLLLFCHRLRHIFQFPGMSVVGELILLPKLQRQRSDDARAFDVGDAVGGISYGAPAWTFGGLYLAYLNGNPRWALGMFVHAMADKLRQIGFGNRLLCHRSLPSGRNPSSKLPQPAVLAALDVKSVVFQAVVIPQLRFYARYRIRKLRKLPTLTGVRQCAPIPAAVRDDRYASVAEVRPCELLVKHPDELVGCQTFFDHEGHPTAPADSINYCEALL